jgi:hypothetical protein
MNLTWKPNVVERKDSIMFDIVLANNDFKPIDAKNKVNLILCLVDSHEENEFGELIIQLQFMELSILEFEDISRAGKMVCND